MCACVCVCRGLKGTKEAFLFMSAYANFWPTLSFVEGREGDGISGRDAVRSIFGGTFEGGGEGDFFRMGHESCFCFCIRKAAV